MNAKNEVGVCWANFGEADRMDGLQCLKYTGLTYLLSEVGKPGQGPPEGGPFSFSSSDGLDMYTIAQGLCLKSIE